MTNIAAPIALRAADPRFEGPLRLRRLLPRDAHLGDARAERIRSLSRVGDPPADALVAEMRSLPPGEGRRRLDAALRHGLHAVEEPGPALAAFIEDVETVPDWLDERRLALASRTMRRTGRWSVCTVLTDISLMGGYVAARPNKVLMRTGELAKKAPLRLTETAAWWIRVTDRGGLDRFAPGFADTVRVRVMHAQIRAAMRRRGDWDEDAWGAPINQSQCAGTVLLFSLVYLLGLRALGFRFTREEREAVIHFWRYVGAVMGVDPVLLAVDEADAWRLLALHAATEACPDEDSRRLAKALTGALPAVRGLTGDDAASRLAAWAVVGWHSALSRLVLGRRTAGGLGLAARPLFAGMVLATAAANFALESARRCLPGATPLGVRIGDRARRRWLDRVTRRVEPNLTFA